MDEHGLAMDGCVYVTYLYWYTVTRINMGMGHNYIKQQNVGIQLIVD